MNQFAATNMPKVFVCPSARCANPGNQNSQKDYGINGGTQAGGCCNERVTTVRDGMAWLGSTVRIADVPDGNGALSGVLPPNYELDNDRGAESDHSDGLFVAFVDGHVAWVSNSINTTLWYNLFTRNGGEAVNPDF